MNEKTNHLHYSALTGTLEDDMWIIDSGASRHMKEDQSKLSNLNEKKTSYKVETKTLTQSKELVKPLSN
jgi:hypothetical protein